MGVPSACGMGLPVIPHIHVCRGRILRAGHGIPEARWLLGYSDLLARGGRHGVCAYQRWLRDLIFREGYSKALFRPAGPYSLQAEEEAGDAEWTSCTLATDSTGVGSTRLLPAHRYDVMRGVGARRWWD